MQKQLCQSWPQLSTVFQARPAVISRSRFICFLAAFEIWSSKCLYIVSLAFICFPVCLVLLGSPAVSLYLSPFMCLVVCPYKCPALHLPSLQRQKAVGFQLPDAGGGASPLLLPAAYVRRVPGSLELRPPLGFPVHPPLCLPP